MADMTGGVRSWFYDPAAFPFTRELERCWTAIHQEYLGIQASLEDWSERHLYEQGWKVFRLFQFPGGELLPENAARCPLTTALIAQHIPRHGAAGFSVLLPGTHIRPHEGYQGRFLRCHLALEVPAGDCGLRVAHERRRWVEGATLVFDDRTVHEAWNRTDRERVILLVDFVPDSPILQAGPGRSGSEPQP